MRRQSEMELFSCDTDNDDTNGETGLELLKVSANNSDGKATHIISLAFFFQYHSYHVFLLLLMPCICNLLTILRGCLADLGSIVKARLET